jgi:predicted ATPase with chaperone activity
MPAGRPTDYSSEIADEICRRISQGETVRQIIAAEGMPAESTIYLWIAKHPEFSEKYARAREVQLERWEDEIVEISDDATNDWMAREEGAKAVDHEHISRSKLRVDTRKWIMSKRLPKKYGDRVDSRVTGADGVGPVKIDHNIEISFVAPGGKL